MRPGDLVRGRFQLEVQAGSGAMGVVYRATDTTTGRRIALKALKGGDVEARKRFAREAEVLAALKHPAIVEYLAHGEVSGEPFLAMEWLEGESLKAVLEERTLSFVEVVEVGEAVSAALAIAHAQGIIHRDLKPANVFLVGRSTAETKVVDFGIARLGGSEMLTATGAMLGTPAYMSPEQVTRARHVDARSDLFSLGAVLFRCVAGRAPFQGEDVMQTILALTSSRAPPVRSLAPQVPPRLAAVIDAVLAPQPADRPADASVVGRMLADARADLVPARATGRDAVRSGTPAFTAPIGAHDQPGAALPFAPKLGPHPSTPRTATGAMVAPTMLAPVSGAAPTALMPEAASPSVGAMSAPGAPARSPAMWWIAVAGALAVVGGGATAAYFAFAKPPTSKPRDDDPPKTSHASSTPSGSSAPASAPSAPALAQRPTPSCPPVATCTTFDVPDPHHADLASLVMQATAFAASAHPGVAPNVVSASGITDQGIDITDYTNGVNLQFDGFGVSSIPTGLMMTETGPGRVAKLPHCDVAAMYRRARSLGLPTTPARVDSNGFNAIFTAGAKTVVLNGDDCQTLIE